MQTGLELYKKGNIAILLLLMFTWTCAEKPKETNSAVMENKDLIKAEPNIEYLYVGTLSGLNLRSRPDPKSDVIKLVEYGEKLEISDKTEVRYEADGIEGKWYKAKYNEAEGFVFSGYLLDFVPPAFVASGSFEKYLPGHFQPIDEKQAYAIKYDEVTYERMLTPVPAEKVEIENESDAFEILEKYQGGRYFKEVIGYEGSTKTIFLPDLDMREGFLMMKIILPYLHIIEKCGLDLKGLPFPSKNDKIKVFENCIFTVDIKKENNMVTSIKYENSDYAYSGISVIKVDGGVEISSYLSL